MRITLGMLNESVRTNLIQSTYRLMEAQDMTSSGTKIRRPSDDIPGVGRSLDLRSTIASIEQFERNSGLADSQLSVTSSTLTSIINALQTVRTLATRAANDTLSEEALQGIASQLEGISRELVGLANTQHLGKYIFSGTLSDTEAIMETGGDPPCVYQGNSEQINVQVAPGTYTTVTVTGDMVFNMGGIAMPDTPDMFVTIKSLRDAVMAGDVSEISNQLKDVQNNLDNVIGIRSQVGAWLNRLTSTTDALSETKVRMKEMLSQTEDVDLAEAVMDLRTRENAYQVAILVSGRVLQTSLADFMK